MATTYQPAPTTNKPKPPRRRCKRKRHTPEAEPRRRVYVALLDFDGLLCDMDTFSYELEDRAAPGRWGRFFGHTSEATPVKAGVELVATLKRLGWRYSVGIVKLFENDCGAVDVSLFGGQIYWLTRPFMPLRWQ